MTTDSVRVIVAGIGYRNLRDHSVGAGVTDLLEREAWPEGLVVEDLSYNPIAVVQRLEDEVPDRRFERAVVVASAERNGAWPGTVVAYRWDGVLPVDEEIHRAVTEAVTGIIAIDNTLVVARHFGALPENVVIVEVEPAVHEFGDTFSDVIARQFETVCTLVRTYATDATAAERLPRAPLGGPALVGVTGT